MIETRLTNEQVHECKLVAKSRAKKPNSKKKISAYSEGEAHFIGLMGEKAFANVTGLKFNPSFKHGGDGGVDFVVNGARIQIKTRNASRSKYEVDLMAGVNEPECYFYVLCEWFEDIPQIVNLVGWCYRKELVKETQDFGYGDAYIMKRKELRDIDLLVQRIRQFMGTRR